MTNDNSRSLVPRRGTPPHNIKSAQNTDPMAKILEKHLAEMNVLLSENNDLFNRNNDLLQQVQTYLSYPSPTKGWFELPIGKTTVATPNTLGIPNDQPDQNIPFDQTADGLGIKPGYDAIIVNMAIGRNGQDVYIVNKGPENNFPNSPSLPGNLFFRYSTEKSQKFSKEFILRFGEWTVLQDVFEIRVRSLFAGVEFEITERQIRSQFAAISGQAVNISGNIVQVVNVSGQCLCVNISGDIIQISGQAVTVSGDIVQISGQQVQVINASGQCLCANISGDIVQISGEAVTISGNIVSMLAPTLLRNNCTQITSFSGGTQLSSGVIVFVQVQNQIGNDPMYIGGVGINSGKGPALVAGQIIPISINNLNNVYLNATTSGQFVCYIAEG